MFRKKDKKLKDNTIAELPTPSVNPNKVLWGIDLEEAARRSDPRWLIPAPIQFTYDYLTSNEKYLQEEGIFRIPGSVSRVQECRAEFDKGLIPTLDDWEVGTATSIFHNFLNNATDGYWNGLGKELAEAEQAEDKKAVHDILLRLPLSKRETLRLVADLCAKISAYGNVNRMTPATLSISIGGSYARCLPYLIEHPEVFPNTILFGVPFKEASDRSGGGIPLPLVRCMECIEEYGLDEDHIYQQSGSTTKIKQYIYEFNSGFDVKISPEDVHCAPGILLSFFRDQTDSIFTSQEEYGKFIAVKDLSGVDTQADSFEKLISKMPDLNASFICAFALHLSKVANAKTNSMTPTTLAVTLGRGFSTVFEPLMICITRPEMKDLVDKYCS